MAEANRNHSPAFSLLQLSVTPSHFFPNPGSRSLKPSTCGAPKIPRKLLNSIFIHSREKTLNKSPPKTHHHSKGDPNTFSRMKTLKLLKNFSKQKQIINKLFDPQTFDKIGKDFSFDELKKYSKDLQKEMKLQQLKDIQEGKHIDGKKVLFREALKELAGDKGQRETKGADAAAAAAAAEEKKPGDTFDFIPKNFVIKNLQWPHTDSRVLLLGVSQYDEHHAHYYLDLLKAANVDIIVTQVPPDLPIFIKTETDYRIAWKKFVTGKFDYKFLLNSNPQSLTDVTLDPLRLKWIMDGPLIRCPEEFELGSLFLYSVNQVRSTLMKEKILDPDCFLTPFLFAYNNPGKKLAIVCNDVPVLQYREKIVRQTSLDELREYMKSFITDGENENFDVRLLNQDIFLKPKIDYMVETLKHSCHIGKNVVCVVDYNLAEFIEEKWRIGTKKLYKFQKFLNPGTQTSDLTFAEYIEKHVMLDIMLGEFIQPNFIAHKSFPYAATNTIGKDTYFEHLFTIWDYFYKRYNKKIAFKTKTMDDLEGKFVLGEDDDLSETEEKKPF